MKKIPILISIICLAFITNAQENTANQWYFGINAGVDFSTGIPIVTTDGQITGWEGCATVGDVNGDLLFYTDGQSIFNKNHQMMQNGSGMMGNYSATQSSIIVPYPNNDSLFYVFTVDAMDNHLQNGLRYSIVNMNLDAGLGGVTATKNVLLETPVAEKITLINHSNNTDVWVLSHRWDTNEFVAYEITTTGINTTPVVTSIGTVHQGGYSSISYNNGWANSIGQIKANMQGTKIALTIYKMNKYELFDFNRATGSLSNFYESPDIYPSAYGVEFSPNGNYLYGTTSPSTGAKTYQFDINQANPFDNAYEIFPNGNYHRSIQIAPNGKIYMGRYNYGYLDVINNPNELGSNSNPVEQEIYLSGNTTNGGLPNLFYYKNFQFFTGSEIDTTICEGDSIYIENAYQTIEETYYDTVNSYLGWDSIINTNLTVLPTLQIPIITENTGVLTSSSSINYQWYFNGDIISGATYQDYQPFVTGTYQVVATNTNDCESWSDEYYFIYVGISNFESGIEVYPNPVQDKLIIDNTEPFKIQITDLKGRFVYNEDVMSNTKKIDMSYIKRGLYLIKIISLTDIKTMKIVKL